jgi:hypothetical protein
MSRKRGLKKFGFLFFNRVLIGKIAGQGLQAYNIWIQGLQVTLYVVYPALNHLNSGTKCDFHFRVGKLLVICSEIR